MNEIILMHRFDKSMFNLSLSTKCMNNNFTAQIDFYTDVKLTPCALGLLFMYILTGQTFLLCCYSSPRGPSSSSLSSPFASLFYCEETLLVVDTRNVDNRTNCVYTRATSYILNIQKPFTHYCSKKKLFVCGINVLNFFTLC